MLKNRDDRIIILSKQDSALVNALQSSSSVILQKSLREGFGLTVTEAMWKGTPVIGGNVGGIRHQIQDGQNGFLVSSIEDTAERIIQLLKNKKLRNQIGKNARETVRKKYLMIHYLEKYLDLFAAFGSTFPLNWEQYHEE
jgi:trehalose synthase